MLLFYIGKIIVSIVRRKKTFKNTDIYKGFNLYFKTSRKDKKNIFLVIYELEKLCIYWKCFPDVYFRFGMFLKSYTDYSLMKTFLPQSAYAKIISSKNDKYNILIDDKILFHKIMTSYRLPTTFRFFIWQNKKFYNDSSVISDEEVNSIISNISDERIFVKRFRGGAASGLFIYSRKKDGYYYDDNNNRLSAELIRKKYYDSNYLFEKQIIQDKELSQFNPNTVNTIRVLTKDDSIVSASVRIGREDQFVDNVAKGGIVLSLDIETGLLSDYGLRAYNIEKYYKHPDSGLYFKNTFISQWESAKKVVLDTLQLLPYYNSVGFDIATTDKGPIIIEINTGAGVNVSQMGKEKGIADKFR